MKFIDIEKCKEYLRSCHYMRDAMLEEELQLSNRIADITNKINEAQMWLRSNKEDK